MELPACVDGLCFHHTIEYLLPLCNGEGEECCDMNGPALGKQGCVAWTWDEAADVSRPTAAPGGSFLCTALAADNILELVKVSSGGEVLWRSPIVENWSSPGPGALPVPAVSSEGMVAVAAAGSVAMFDAEGKPATKSGKPVALEAGGAVTLCPGGSAYAQAQDPDDVDVLYAIAAGKSEIPFPVRPDPVEPVPEFGELPRELGPIIFKSRGLAVLPVDSGHRLLAADMEYDVVEGKGDLVKRWVYPDAPLPAPMAGLAADSTPRVYLATRTGVVHALNPGPGDSLDALHWKSDVPADKLLPIELPPMVSKVGTESRVYLAGKNGSIFYVSFVNPEPVVVADLNGSISGAALLRQDRGVVAAVPGNGFHKLLFSVAAGSIPGLNEPAGTFVERSWTMTCDSLTFSTPLPDGIVAVACDGLLLGLVAPDYTSPSTTWPTPRGPGNAGCVD